MDVASGNEGVYPRHPSRLQCPRDQLDVRLTAARKRRDPYRGYGAATLRTASKSPDDAIGNPTSMTSTLSSLNLWAINSFSSTVMLQPDDCSPSRRVVSEIVTRSFIGLSS